MRRQNIPMLLFFLPLLTLPSATCLEFIEPVLHTHVARLISMSASIDPSTAHCKQCFQPLLGTSVAPAPSRVFQGHVAAPFSGTFPRHRRHHHRVKIRAVSPSPPSVPGCGQICTEPLTSTPMGSPCGCVLPMKVRLLLDVSLYSVFPIVNALAIEVAAGTYLERSQVSIIGANADSLRQERTVVDINLVPLGETFDNTTAIMTYERFWLKKVPLNRTLFGNYEVMYVKYPGLPSTPSPGNSSHNGSSGGAGNQQIPIMADVIKKSDKMKLQIVFIITLSTLMLLVVGFVIASILLTCRKFGRASNTVGPALAPSINKRYGIGSILSSSLTSSTSLSLVSVVPASILSVKTFALAEVEKATKKFSSRRVLGEGGFGRVFHGIMEDGTEVAVKLLTREDESWDREFIAEVEMLSRLHHRNLVKLIGICIEGCIRCLIYELVPNGSVESHLHGADKRKKALCWDARLKIALGAARGLAYLHEDSNPRVIHRDFKAGNILLENDFTPKVSDFGLAREATDASHHISTRVMGTFGYVAPEYAMTGHLLVKSDVYSYGVVLLELLSGRHPVDMSQPLGQENLVTWARPLLTSREGLGQLVDPSLADSYDFDDVAKVAAIASMCVHSEVSHRPFMGEVVQALKLIYNDTDETCGDCYSQRESSAADSDLIDIFPSDSSWNAGGVTPHLIHGHTSSFMTMEYGSSPLKELENVPLSPSTLTRGGFSTPISHGNRSGPLRTTRSKPAFFRLKGCISEHGGFLSRHAWNKGKGIE